MFVIVFWLFEIEEIAVELILKYIIYYCVTVIGTSYINVAYIHICMYIYIYYVPMVRTLWNSKYLKIIVFESRSTKP